MDVLPKGNSASVRKRGQGRSDLPPPGRTGQIVDQAWAGASEIEQVWRLDLDRR